MSESIYRALTNLSAREAKPKKIINKSILNKPDILSISVILISLIVFIIASILKNKILVNISVIILFIGYAGLLLSPIYLAFYHRKKLCKNVKNPLGVIINNAKQSHDLDSKYINYFVSKEKEALERVFLELNSEKESFATRVSLIIGAIEKVGLFPGVIAFFITLSKIDNIEFDWVLTIAYAIPILYFMGVYSHFLINRMNRHIELIKYAIQQKTP